MVEAENLIRKSISQGRATVLIVQKFQLTIPIGSMYGILYLYLVDLCSKCR